MRRGMSKRSHRQKQNARNAVTLGRYFFLHRHFDMALKEFRWAAQRQPENLHPFVNLGITLMALHGHHEALESWRTGLALDPENTKAKFYLAEALTQMHRFEDARTLWNEVLESKADEQWTDLIREKLFLIERGMWGPLDYIQTLFEAALH